MLKRPLFISLFLFFLLIIDIIHSTLIGNALKEQFAQLQESGLQIDNVTEHSSLLSDKKNFTLKIVNIGKLTEHLFGLKDKDALTIAFSKYEGTSFKVELAHYKYIFSNNIHVLLTLDELPEEFTKNSTFLTNLVNYFRDNAKLFKIDFNLWNKEFKVRIHSIDETIAADQAISYHIQLEGLIFHGLIISNEQFDLWGTTKKFDIAMMTEDKNITDLSTTELSLAFQRSPELWQVNLSLHTLDILLNSDQPTHISLVDLDATQNNSNGETISIYSKLDLSNIIFQNTPYDYQVKNFSYELLLDNINQKALEKMRDLIDDSNTNSVSFIFEDLEKSLDTLLKDKVSLKINRLKFDDLILNNKHYNKVNLELFAQNQPEKKPYNLDFEMDLSVSTELFHLFSEEVPNADQIKVYVKNEEADNVRFHLELTPEGFRLNDHLLQEAEPILLQDEHNYTDDDIILDEVDEVQE